MAAASSSARDRIRDQDNVLLRLPSGVYKHIKITPTANIPLGKYGSFKAKDLIGKPFGETYEIKAGLLHVVQTTLNEIEETSANNQNILAQAAVTLSFAEIEALKASGMSGRDIIAKQVEEHSQFEQKTEYSKEKYLKRKEAKYLQLFTTVEPTTHAVCQYHSDKSSENIREMRPDTLAQIMALANVRPGGRTLVVEDVHGLVVGAALERMGGEGRLLIINDADSPPDILITELYNFLPAQLEPVESIHWAATDPAYVPPSLPLEIPENTPKSKSVREQNKVKKRKALYEKTERAREEYFEGGFDSIILACEYEPYSVLERVLPYLGGSASIVVYSPYLAILFAAQQRMKQEPSFLTPSITEPFLRRYQVLPGRTHPEMQGMGHGGYLLTSTRVYDDPEANSYLLGARQKKKRKAEELALGAGTA